MRLAFQVLERTAITPKITKIKIVICDDPQMLDDEKIVPKESEGMIKEFTVVNTTATDKLTVDSIYELAVAEYPNV